jgi:hypothetical protein
MRTCLLFFIVAFFTMETGLSAKEYTELLGEDSLQYKWWYNGKGHGYSLFVESYMFNLLLISFFFLFK